MDTIKKERYSRLEKIVLNRVNNPTEFSSVNHIRITKAFGGLGEGELSITESSLNPHKNVHGGCLYTLADTVCGAAAGSTGKFCVTMSSTMNFLRQAKNGKMIYCSAVPEKIGRTVSVFRFVISAEDGETIAVGTSTYYHVADIELQEDDMIGAKPSNCVQ